MALRLNSLLELAMPNPSRSVPNIFLCSKTTALLPQIGVLQSLHQPNPTATLFFRVLGPTASPRNFLLSYLCGAPELLLSFALGHHQLRVWSLHTWANKYHFPTPTLCHLGKVGKVDIICSTPITYLSLPSSAAHTAGRAALPSLGSYRSQGLCSPWGGTQK